ncbi:MAG TPA: CinA family protein [Haploplasma sp.]|nr:CinA family protein [Haploplasma sp.]
MKELLDKLLSKQLTIAFAESMTGGYISSELTKIPEASKAFLGSVVSYSQDVKMGILNVKKETINKYSLVSSNVSLEMARGLLKVINANISVSITGNAGPTLEANTNELECYITVIFRSVERTINYRFKENNRLNNIIEATNKVIEIVNEIIEEYQTIFITK